jgi:hypothetical protein
MSRQLKMQTENHRATAEPDNRRVVFTVHEATNKPDNPVVHRDYHYIDAKLLTDYLSSIEPANITEIKLRTEKAINKGGEVGASISPSWGFLKIFDFSGKVQGSKTRSEIRDLTVKMETQ